MHYNVLKSLSVAMQLILNCMVIRTSLQNSNLLYLHDKLVSQNEQLWKPFKCNKLQQNNQQMKINRATLELTEIHGNRLIRQQDAFMLK